jgi:hypothetical protein
MTDLAQSFNHEERLLALEDAVRRFADLAQMQAEYAKATAELLKVQGMRIAELERKL